MTSRTLFAKISAPPPGQESIPASFSSRIVSTRSFLPTRAIQSSSTIVQALMWTPGNRGAERAEEAGVVVVGERRVEAADDVQLGDPVVPAGRRLAHGLLDRHRVAAGDARLPRPGAEAAVDPAEVRRVQVAVDVVVAEVPVPPLALAVRERADAEEVRRPEEDEAVLEREPLARERLLGDGDGGRGRSAGRGAVRAARGYASHPSRSIPPARRPRTGSLRGRPPPSRAAR